MCACHGPLPIYARTLSKRACLLRLIDNVSIALQRQSAYSLRGTLIRRILAFAARSRQRRCFSFKPRRNFFTSFLNCLRSSLFLKRFACSKLKTGAAFFFFWARAFLSRRAFPESRCKTFRMSSALTFCSCGASESLPPHVIMRDLCFKGCLRDVFISTLGAKLSYIITCTS